MHASHVNLIVRISHYYWCIAEYGYNEKSENGPKHWGDLKNEWAACKGDMQSPIDLSSHRVTLIPNTWKLKSSYKPQHATVSNRGHDVAVSILIYIHANFIYHI
jgi:carbonic anhydrase